jgi:hypothetical protein
MANSESQQRLGEQRIQAMLGQLEARIARLEAHLGLSPIEKAPSPYSPSSVPVAGSGEESLAYDAASVEMRIGEFGLAWIGSLIFLLGIVFLMTYTFSLGYPILASILGYLATIGLYLLARFWRNTTPHLSQLTLSGSLLLLFYTTMRLHFFSATPLVENVYLAFSLLLLVVALDFYLALHRDSQSQAGLAMSLGMAAVLLIDKTHLSLSLVAINASLIVFLAIRHNWRRLLIATIILTYGTHLLWLLNNPVAGHPWQGVSEHQYNLGYLFLYAAIFSCPALLHKKVSPTDALSIAALLFNCLGFSLLTLLVILTHHQQSYAAIYLAVAGLFLLLSIIQWLKTHHQLAPAIYACFGYMALSIAIYGYTALPTAFLWLSLQSLLVVSMALWFRSRILVVVNSLIYVGILITYLTISPSSNAVNFSFAAVAHASARIMNWQKERLTLRTDALRNLYLLIAFVMALYALFQAVSSQYVTLSWTLLAAGYFVLSYRLRNIKYRWMAIVAVFITVLYLFLVDLARLDPRFRVAAFLLLGLMALVISLFYTRIRRLLGKRGNWHS